MDAKRKVWALAVSACTSIGLICLGESARAEGNRGAVELLADRQAATPGQEIQLALRFHLDKDEYLFWKHPGRGGRAPAASWLEPAGGEFGPLLFPNPEKHDTGGGVMANALVGEEVVLLCSHRVAKGAEPGGVLTLRAAVSWSAGGSAIQDHQETVELKLPIATPGAPDKPTNEEVFEYAGYSLPIAASKARYIKLKTGLNPSAVTPGGQASARIEFKIAQGFHAQAHDPGVEGLIGVEVFVDPPAGVTVGEIQFPAGKKREVKYLGTVKEYDGTVQLDVPMTFSSEFSGPAMLRGILRYQACEEKTGMCFPPEHVAWSLPIPVKE